MMKRWNKVLALILVLAMLLSAFALADVELEVDGETSNEVELEVAALDDGLVIDGVATEGESLPIDNAELDLDLGLELDLDGVGLETLEGELAPVTKAAMNASSGSYDDPIEINDWKGLVSALAAGVLAGEDADNPTYYILKTDVNWSTGDSSLWAVIALSCWT